MARDIVMPAAPGGSGIAARIDAATRIPATHLASIPPPPRSVKIELTAHCNLRCGYCTQRQRAGERGEMAWPLYTQLVGEIADAGVAELGLYLLGESFLCDWLPEAVAYAKARGIAFTHLTTNGTLATPERVRACMDAGLDSLRFTVNLPDEGTFRDVTLAKGTLFHASIENLKAARRVRDAGSYPCGLFASSLTHDAGVHERMQALVNEILPYVDEHYWVPHYSTSAAGAPLTPSPHALRQPAPCWSLFTQAHVTWDGLLSACCFDAGEAWVMADLKEAAFLDGWASERFALLRDAHLRGDVRGTPCEGCVARW